METSDGVLGRADPVRVRAAVHGAVQGVGFRPFVWRLAARLKLAGWVENTPQGVLIEAEGAPAALEEFLIRLRRDAPPRAAPAAIETWRLEPAGGEGFAVRASGMDGARTAYVPPDAALCAACVRELRDPADRRHRHPFISCTACGPRYTIILGLPYDRARTTMAAFPLCPRCRAEYGQPADRRFHAEPVCCPDCGPALELTDPAGRRLAGGDAALRRAAEAVRDGAILALKGIGGYHLIADARRDGAVRELRRRKRREAKPLAVMTPGLRDAAAWAGLSLAEARLLRSPEAPIVLLDRRPGGGCAPSVAPGLGTLGVMLPYSPVHRLLLDALGFPVVATSGNLTDEPICTDEAEALVRLGVVADVFLSHDRPIARAVDDSVVRVMAGRPQVLRRARGYAPLPFTLPRAGPPLVAAGGHAKSAVAVSDGRHAFLSQHLGDLGTPETRGAFETAAADLARLLAVAPAAAAHDAHPDYASTGWARRSGWRTVAVQHHLAHVLACLADNGLEPPVLGVALDGTGLGDDGTAWGGEFLLLAAGGARRAGRFRRFRLPGGDAAAREPRRAALGVLYELLGGAALDRVDLAPVASFAASERRVLRTALTRGLNAPVTSSVGRLFDAAASLAGVRHAAQFEGQAAMEFEALAASSAAGGSCPAPVAAADGLLEADWGPAILALIAEAKRGVPAADAARRFHRAVAALVGETAARIGCPRVALTGGCFQNRVLLEDTIAELAERGLAAVWHQRCPPNDGGIALGQAVFASGGGA